MQTTSDTTQIKFKPGRPHKNEIRPPTNKPLPKIRKICLTCERSTSHPTQTCSKCQYKNDKYHLKYWRKNQQAHKLEKIINYIQQLDRNHSDQLKQLLNQLLQSMNDTE